MIVKYNGLTLDCKRFWGFEFTPIFSPDGSEYLRTQVSFDVEATLDVSAANPGGYADIKALLMEPGKAIEFDDEVKSGKFAAFIPRDISTPDRDPSFGAKPLGCNLLDLCHEAGCRFRWSIQWYVIES